MHLCGYKNVLVTKKKSYSDPVGQLMATLAATTHGSVSPYPDSVERKELKQSTPLLDQDSFSRSSYTTEEEESEPEARFEGNGPSEESVHDSFWVHRLVDSSSSDDGMEDDRRRKLCYSPPTLFRLKDSLLAVPEKNLLKNLFENSLLHVNSAPEQSQVRT